MLHFGIYVLFAVTSCTVELVLRIEEFPFLHRSFDYYFCNESGMQDEIYTTIWYGKCILLLPILKEYSLLFIS